MSTMQISAGTIHGTIPEDLRTSLMDDAGARAAWEDITPLARNEFLCWVENAKAIETRTRRIRRTIEELNEGKRRPCCWIGCIHRTDKALSPSVQAILAKK